MVGVDAQLARLLPFIFAPKEASIEKPRVDTWKAYHADGQSCMAKIAVMGTFNGDDDLRSLLVLFKIAQDTTLNDDGSVDFTIKQHARLGRRGWSGRGHGRNKNAPSTPDDIAASLLRLRLVGFMPSRVYTDDEGHRIEISEPITFLDKLRLVRRSVIDPETGDEHTDALTSRFRFNEYMRKQLATAPLKPIVFDTAMALPRSHPYALRAYLTFDRNLSPKNATHYEWSATALLDELGLTLTDTTPSARRRFLDGLIKHLNGKAISRGVLHLERRPTDDGKDCKLILTRTAHRPRTRQLNLPITDEQRPAINMRDHFDQHRTVHPEPVGDCDTCKGIAAMHRLGILKRPAPPQDHAPVETKPEAQPAPIATPDTTPAPEATLLPDDQQPPVATDTTPDPVPTVEAPTPLVGVLSFESLTRAVAPEAPEQSEPAPSAGAPREGSASHSEPAS